MILNDCNCGIFNWSDGKLKAAGFPKDYRLLLEVSNEQTFEHFHFFPLVVDHKKEFFHVYPYPAFWPKWHTKSLPRKISGFLKQKHWFRRNKSSCADTIGLSEGFPGGSARGYTDRFHKFHEFQRDTRCEVPGSTWGGRDTGGAGRHGPWSPSDGRLGFLVTGSGPGWILAERGCKISCFVGIYFFIFFMRQFLFSPVDFFKKMWKTPKLVRWLIPCLLDSGET